MNIDVTKMVNRKGTCRGVRVRTGQLGVVRRSRTVVDELSDVNKRLLLNCYNLDHDDVTHDKTVSQQK